MPQAKHQSVERELQRVVAAVDQPKLQGATGKQVVDAEARRHPAKARAKSRARGEAQLRLRAEEHREHRGRHEAEDQGESEYHSGMAVGLVRVHARLAAPRMLEQRAVPES